MAFYTIGQSLAQQIDKELMDPAAGGFTLAQLMELAGLSVAQSIKHAYKNARSVVVVCGPGNNGGDGLVAARHLSLFGMNPVVFTPRKGKNPYFDALYTQLENVGVPTFFAADSIPKTVGNGSGRIIRSMDHEQFVESLASCDLIVDAIFGFSFKGPLRAPFDNIVDAINASGKPVASIDMPSGWDVEKGKVDDLSISNPDMLISLTIPKIGAKDFKGRHHFLGGRFIPNSFSAKYKFSIPKYPGYSQFVDISNAALIEQHQTPNNL